MGRFDGQVVMITGAARGLGRDYARRFAADGAHVVLADVTGADAPAEEASRAGTRCIGVLTDVTDRASVDRAVARSLEEFGRLDALINNAGLWRGLGQAGLLECPDKVWESAWAVNVTGTLHGYQAVAPTMVRAGAGRIVNISSMAARSGGSVYGLTKNAVEQMTRGMAAEMGPHGVTVNCIAPGISAFDGARASLDTTQEILAGNAIKRLGTSDDLYAALAYLCGPAASWVTGQTIRIDGGNAL